jgi:hypothetical protein
LAGREGKISLWQSELVKRVVAAPASVWNTIESNYRPYARNIATRKALRDTSRRGEMRKEERKGEEGGERMEERRKESI